MQISVDSAIYCDIIRHAMSRRLRAVYARFGFETINRLEAAKNEKNTTVQLTETAANGGKKKKCNPVDRCAASSTNYRFDLTFLGLFVVERRRIGIIHKNVLYIKKKNKGKFDFIESGYKRVSTRDS